MRIEIRVLICLSIALLLFSIAAVCHAQTNPATVIPVSSTPVSVDKIANDIGTVCSDFGFDVSIGAIMKILVGVFFLARIALKYWAKDPSSLVYKIASHAALQAPTAQPTPVNPPKTP